MLIDPIMVACCRERHPMSAGDAGPRVPVGDDEGGEQIGWIELFFDLVVVAAVAVLTEGLREDPTLPGLGLFALLYTGIWFSWVSVVLYANVAGRSTKNRTIVWGMALVAVMAATAPSHFASRANAFAIGFVALRVIVSRSSLMTGRMLTGWPLLQFGGATAPWIVAMWVDTPAKYVLWALGLGLDLALVLMRGGRVDEERLTRLSDRLEEETAQRRAHQEKRRQRSWSRRREPPAEIHDIDVEAVDVDSGHLSERLGTLVIIVLGEIVSQLVLTASTSEWTHAFVGVAFAAFWVLVGLWWLTFSYGFVGAPHARMATMQPRFGLPMHLLSTVGIVVMAAGIGQMAREPGRTIDSPLQWIMSGGLALHFLVMGVAGWSGGAPRRWLFGWALPCVVAPLVVAGLGERLTNERTMWLLALPIAWMASYGRLGVRPDDRDKQAVPTADPV